MLRHGETAWNTERRMQGPKNSDLTERGRAPGARHGPDPQSRARPRARPDDLPAQPARPHARDVGDHRPRTRHRHREWREDLRLAELSYGDWEGFSWAEIEIDHPTALADWRADPHGYCPPGGETHIDLRRRCAAVLTEIATSASRTVVVSHGVSGAVVRGLNLGLDARAMFVLEKPQDAFFRLPPAEERIEADD